MSLCCTPQQAARNAYKDFALIAGIGITASIQKIDPLFAAQVIEDSLPSTEPIPGCICDGGGAGRGAYCGCFTVNQTTGKKLFSDPIGLTELGCSTMGPDFEATACYEKSPEGGPDTLTAGVL